MTLDGFLTFLSICIAAYALVTPASRLRLRLLWGLPLLISVTSLFLTIYLILFDKIQQPCPPQLGLACELLDISRLPISANDIAFFFVLLSSLALFAALQRKRISRSALTTLEKTIAELVAEDRYKEAVELFQPNLALLKRASSNQLALSKLRNRLRLLNPRNHDFFDRIAPVKTAPPLLRWISVFYKGLPDGKRAADASSNIYSSIANSPGAISYIAKRKPVLGLEMQFWPEFESAEFSEKLYEFWLNDSSSFYFRELTKPRSGSFNSNYEFGPDAPLHHKLFTDFTTYPQPNTWSPVGDNLIKMLRSYEYSGYIQRLNEPFLSTEKERTNDRTLVSKDFFDTMVRSAAHHGSDDHMWLMYLGYAADAILEIYDDTHPKFDPNEEFANRAEYILYELFLCLTGWAFELASELPDDNPNISGTVKYGDRDYDTIPKSAANCLASSFRRLVEHDKIRFDYKVYIAEVIFRGLGRMGSEENIQSIKDYSIECLLTPSMHGSVEDYINTLKSIWHDMDHTIRADASEFEDQLSKVA